MRVTSTGTPIPKRDIEAKSCGNGPVITYQLSPEELERVRRGEKLEKKEEQTMSTTTAPKERALTEPPQQRTDWSEWYAVAEVNGISLITFRTRIYRGWTPERAATEPPRPRKG